MAKVTVEVKGIKHTLFFGMVAVQVYVEKVYEEIMRLNEGRIPSTGADVVQVSNMKSFAFLIHGGLCNMAEAEERSHPSFTESYEIADDILCQPVEVQEEIWRVYSASRASETMLKKLDQLKKKGEESAPTGSESAPTLLEHSA